MSFSVGVTLGFYALSRVLARHYPSPLTTPVFFSTALTILALLACGLEDRDYAPAREIMTFLLGPATVALAVPIYKNRHILLAGAWPALVGIAAGSLSTLFAAVLLAELLGASRLVLSSISLKSVTAPIAVEIAEILNGNPSLTAAFVVATGMMGAMLGPWFLSRVGIHDSFARGLSLGTISHGQGTAQAAIEGELPGAIAGIAMGVAAVFVSFLAPTLIPALIR
jgi:putative effector of murein hydrolase